MSCGRTSRPLLNMPTLSEALARPTLRRSRFAGAAILLFLILRFKIQGRNLLAGSVVCDAKSELLGDLGEEMGGVA